MESPRDSTTMEFVPSPETPRDTAITHVNALYENENLVKRMDAAAVEDFETQVHQLPEWQQYQRQRIRYDTFDTVRRFVANQAGHRANGEPLTNDIEALASLGKAIQGGVSRYYATVMRMEGMRRQAFRLDPEDYKHTVASLDQNRRMIHNGLMSDLTAFTRYCNTKVPEHTEVSVPQELLFSPQELQDRDLIGTWAFDTELGRRIEAILKAAQEKRTGSGGA